MRASLHVCVTVLAWSVAGACAQFTGVINDPDGFTLIRAQPDGESKVMGKALQGEAFEFQPVEGSDWWKVSLPSGVAGWMHSSRMRLHHTLDELPGVDDERAEVTAYGESKGFHYAKTARSAALGDAAAMKTFFGIDDVDGGAAEGHAWTLEIVLHVLGDEKLASFVATQPFEFQIHVRNTLVGAIGPFSQNEYLAANFPRTFHLLGRKECLDWTSPDGHYAIRKVFSEGWATKASRVLQAGLVERSSGRQVLDLLADDIGAGLEREGRVLWAPDATRFAYFSGGPGGPGRTVVFEAGEAGFRRVGQVRLSLPDPAPAKIIWTHEEPVRWAGASTLVIWHHDYMEGKHADGSIDMLARVYDVTWDLASGAVRTEEKPW